ncbi:hypothetical protein JY651_36560 [Pyxidicoccus parkwayensis]|uniref:DUF4440 domain-containing protein n=1 Tax=Pyxidicoccus parkwayensis TaxID=2813578 RepID=A0ABX7NPJ0_9BACT|nr:hypothetical protein [Pyxidicoccus parkwaysis]QSQ20705.1 hypothetical protein JY651_36560 [Pyxidicoccus parkwaysis]
MMRRFAVCVVSLVLSAPVWAQEEQQQQDVPPATGGSGQQPMDSSQKGAQPAVGAGQPMDSAQQEGQPATGGAGQPMDMDKMGPWTRKPTQEAKTKKDVEAFLKEEDDIMKRRDFQASLSRIDFPIFMVTDDSKGVPKGEAFDEQKYTQTMKPSMEQGPEVKDLKHNRTLTVLSDSLVSFSDEYSMTMGGKKRVGRSSGLLIKTHDGWKWKAYFEPGWGDQPTTGVGGSGQPEKKHEHVKPKQ